MVDFLLHSTAAVFLTIAGINVCEWSYWYYKKTYSNYFWSPEVGDIVKFISEYGKSTQRITRINDDGTLASEWKTIDGNFSRDSNSKDSFVFIKRGSMDEPCPWDCE